MLIFVFVGFSVLLLLSLLCCYVVKLGKARKQQKQKNTQKKWKYFRVFSTRQVMVACAKVIVFGGAVLLFFLVAQKHYTNRVFEDFDMFNFIFWVKFVGSITWPR